MSGLSSKPWFCMFCNISFPSSYRTLLQCVIVYLYRLLYYRFGFELNYISVGITFMSMSIDAGLYFRVLSMYCRTTSLYVGVPCRNSRKLKGRSSMYRSRFGSKKGQFRLGTCAIWIRKSAAAPGIDH